MSKWYIIGACLIFSVETSVKCQHSAEALSAAEITEREKGGSSSKPGPGGDPSQRGEVWVGAASMDPALSRQAVGT